jgi:microcystin-dependent protein
LRLFSVDANLDDSNISKNLETTSVPQNPFLGEIFASASNFAPQGYAFCDGTVLSIQQNPALFSLLGTTYGGNGINTFALPDLRGRVGVMFGQGNGLSPYNLGDSSGSESVSLNILQMPQHNHLLNVGTANGSSASPANAAPAKSSQADKVYGAANGAVMAGNTIATSGGNQPHENRPPFLALNYYIALQGIFPVRS